MLWIQKRSQQYRCVYVPYLKTYRLKSLLKPIQCPYHRYDPLWTFSILNLTKSVMLNFFILSLSMQIGKTYGSQLQCMFGIFAECESMYVRKPWEAFVRIVIENCHPIHLLWMLVVEKSYDTVAVYSAINGMFDRTFRKWTWLYIRLIDGLKLVNFLSSRDIFNVEISQ